MKCAWPSGGHWPDTGAGVAGGCADLGPQHIFARPWIFLPAGCVEAPMTKKDKIAFIKSSKRKTHVYHDLARYSDQQLNDVIREIVHGLVRESEIIANAYINGYRS